MALEERAIAAEGRVADAERGAAEAKAAETRAWAAEKVKIDEAAALKAFSATLQADLLRTQEEARQAATVAEQESKVRGELLAKAQEAEAKARGELAAKAQEAEGLQKANVELRMALASATLEAEEAGVRADKAEKDLADLGARASDLSDELRIRLDEVAELTDVQQALKVASTDAAARAERAEGRAQAAELAQQEARAAEAAARATAQVKSDEAAAMKDFGASLQADLARAEGARAVAEQRATALEGEVAEARKAKAELDLRSDMVQRLSSRNVELRAETAKLNARVAQLTESVKVAECALEEMQLSVAQQQERFQQQQQQQPLSGHIEDEDEDEEEAAASDEPHTGETAPPSPPAPTHSRKRPAPGSPEDSECADPASAMDLAELLIADAAGEACEAMMFAETNTAPEDTWEARPEDESRVLVGQTNAETLAVVQPERATPLLPWTGEDSAQVPAVGNAVAEAAPPPQAPRVVRRRVCSKSSPGW